MHIFKNAVNRKVIKTTWILISLLSFSSFHFPKHPQPQLPKISVLPNTVQSEVIGIQDGDTVELKLIFTGKKAGHRTGMPLRVRLLHVDCPERGMPYYQVAKQFTAERCFRKTVSVRHTGKFDRYGRLLGEIILPDGRTLNKELLRRGYAVHFKKYSSSQEYAALENLAKSKKIGIWKNEGVNSKVF